MIASINSVLRRRLLLAAALIFAVWASWEVSIDNTAQKTGSPRSAPPRRSQGIPATPAAATIEPTLSGKWPLQADPHERVVDLFSIPAPLPLAGAFGAGAAAGVPVLKLTYVGRLLGNSNDRVFLSDAQDRVISTQVGDSVGDGWKLTAMESKQLVFRHAATGQEQTMQIGAFQ
ncbi:MAG: hypothetical protein WCH44_04005 [Betaproteobacteria bacterium]